MPQNKLHNTFVLYCFAAIFLAVVAELVVVAAGFVDRWVKLATHKPVGSFGCCDSQVLDELELSHLLASTKRCAHLNFEGFILLIN